MCSGTGIQSLRRPHTDTEDERKLLDEYLRLSGDEATAKKRVTEAQKTLDAKVAAQYTKLTEAEIKTLVVDDKWLATLTAAIESELARVSQALAQRICQLAERYATPLPTLTREGATLAAQVDEHLKAMGFEWH